MRLIFGKTGQLASSLKETSLGSTATFIDSGEADFRVPASILRALEKHSPKLIINTAAYTKVDLAEKEREECMAINADALRTIGAWAAANGAKVIHISTDYVFPGDERRKWTEHDAPRAINHYGESKLEGERRLLESGSQFAVFRTSWLFSEFGTNFVKTMLKLGESRETLSVVNDQTGRPTYAGDLALFIERLVPSIESGHINGIYHVSNSGEATWFEFAESIFESARARGFALAVKKVAPIGTAEYPVAASRPAYSVLDTTRTHRELGVELPHWRDALVRCLAKLGTK